MYWLIVLRPCSPSFFSCSKVVETEVISWMMMEAEMYGMMFRAKIAIRWMPPPENMLNMPRKPPAWVWKICSQAAGSMPGSGM